MATLLSLFLLVLSGSNATAFTLSMGSETKAAQFGNVGCRRSFLSTACATVVGGTSVLSQSQPSYAATAKEIITAPSGIKYAVTKETSDKKPVTPYKGDFVAIDYTGYLANGQIFDATHSEGKSNSLLFKLGSGSVIPGLDDLVSRMVVGQKVQAIIPPSLAYGEKGVCLDDGECLIKPEWHVGGVRIHTEIQAEGQNTLGLRAKEDGWPPVQPAFMGIQLRAIETLAMLT